MSPFVLYTFERTSAAGVLHLCDGKIGNRIDTTCFDAVASEPRNWEFPVRIEDRPLVEGGVMTPELSRSTECGCTEPARGDVCDLLKILIVRWAGAEVGGAKSLRQQPGTSRLSRKGLGRSKVATFWWLQSRRRTQMMNIYFHKSHRSKLCTSIQMRPAEN